MQQYDQHTLPAYYYYIDPETAYKPQTPSPLDDLISVYGLSDLSRQVARTTPDGGKAVKLRKSYKNQISDLSGKFNVIPNRENGKGGELAQILFQNNPDMLNQVNRSKDMSQEEYFNQLRDRDLNLFQQSNNLDWNVCENVLAQFGKSYPSEFQNQQDNGFVVDDLAFDLDGTGKATSNNVNNPNGKKRKNKSNGSSMATPTSDVQDDLKRRRLE
ncbi:hypothetical protein NCAS_0E02420 [Naumovozyma castellii]|uniref:Mediator of RNA polymerase II transcription subunit 19 n=1 Tax=Naumovozyma castellii TaxID=27288 RepID=G0VFP5_NAUCA|nr:hypothetical protein NCAS_0E02420 [Naumovozyma castellii CBS 4309]CCC70312.1 hypothetical protein NCAS_0E02420 [Naumovozyma castellii CBS 4309]